MLRFFYGRIIIDIRIVSDTVPLDQVFKQWVNNHQLSKKRFLAKSYTFPV